jgi:adenylate cyclase
MSTSGLLLCHNPLVTRLVTAAAGKLDVKVSEIDKNVNPAKAICDENPRILFVDESVLTEKNRDIIMNIRDMDEVDEIFIIVTSTNNNWSHLSRELGSDAFLPVPFSRTKFNSLFRGILNHPRIVLVTSHPRDDVSGFISALKDKEYEVIQAYSGDECMILTHRHFPDLVISGLDLPDMSGIALARKLKQANLSSRIPVMVMSEDSRAETIEECFHAGIKDVILSPYDTPGNMVKITTIIPPAKKGRKQKALIIDDSLFVRNMITKMFKKLGFDTVTGENGLQGLKVAEKEVPDVITCDYDMPVMNGWEFCIEAKKNEKIKDIPIVMVTARGAGVDKKKGKVLGVEEYLVKPFKEPELQKVLKVLEESRKKKEQDAISKYVARDVLKNVSEVIEGIKGKEPEEKFITVLFSDICSFTPKCERLGPRDIVTLLNSYFNVMITILQENNAIVDKLIGDAIVARFDSGNRENDALSAAASACAMLSALKEFNTTRTEKIEVRIGINSGNVILGNIGSESFRLDYTMIGDNVNVGQRLESMSSPMGCLVSKSTYELIQKQVEVGPAQTLALKGKSRRVTAYPLLAVYPPGR